MGRIASKLTVHARMARRGDVRGIATDYARWIRSEEAGSGQRLELKDLRPSPEARVEFTFRPVTSADLDRVFDTSGLSHEDARELDARWRIWRSGIPTCYGAFVDGGDAAYLGWAMLGKTHRDEIREFFTESFLPVGDDELLVEGSWVHPKYRGRSVFVPALHALVSTGLEHGVVRAVAYAADDNPAAWLGGVKLGFQRFAAKRTTWRFFRCKTVWTMTDVQLERPVRS